MSNNLESQIKKYFLVQKLTFLNVGINPLACSSKKIIQHPMVLLLSFSSAFTFSIAIIDFGLKHTDDMAELTLALSLLSQLLIAIFKVSIFYFKRQQIWLLVKELWKWYDETTCEEEQQIIENINKTNVFVCKLYAVAVFSAGMMGLIRPFVLTFIMFITGSDNLQWAIPHQATYLWNTNHTFGYLLSLLYNVVTIHYLFSSSVAIDTLFLWLVANIICRFRILNYRLASLALKANDNFAKKSLIRNVYLHRNTLDLAKSLDSIFCEIVFIKSLISCTQICFLAFRFTAKDATIENLLYPFSFLSAVALQLILYCFSGQLIQDESQQVSEKIYLNFTWANLSTSFKKSLHLIMLRAQKRCNITGIFFNLDLNLYLWFFKTAGSLIAFLKTMDGEE